MNILNYQNYNEKELREKSILDMMKDDYKTIKNFINEKRKYIFCNHFILIKNRI